MKTVEELAEIVLDRCETVTSLGETTQRFRIAHRSWYIRDRDGGWVSIEDPATLVQAALLRHCAERKRSTCYRVDTDDYEVIAKQAFDKEVVAKVVEHLNAGKNPRAGEYCFDLIALTEQPERLSFLTSGRNPQL